MFRNNNTRQDSIDSPLLEPQAHSKKSCYRYNYKTSLLYLVTLSSFIYFAMRVLNDYSDGKQAIADFKNLSMPALNGTCADAYHNVTNSPYPNEPLCIYKDADDMLDTCKQLIGTVCEGTLDAPMIMAGVVAFFGMLTMLMTHGARTDNSAIALLEMKAQNGKKNVPQEKKEEIESIDLVIK